MNAPGRWTVDTLCRQLRALGIGPGDHLFVHTSLRATGLSRNETDLLYEAYREMLGDTGALFFPTHTYCFKGMAGHPVFDLDAPCHPNIGLWPERMRRRKEARRSSHPTHSVGGLGPGVERILAGHDATEAVGFDSPLDRLCKRGGKVLLVGCGFEACTLIHLAETYARVPYLPVPPHGLEPAALARRHDKVAEIPLREIPGCSLSFPRIEPLLRALGAVVNGQVAAAPTMLCEMPRLLDATARMLEKDPESLLCRQGCPTCADARKALRRGYACPS